jgi:hypothetical protein
LRRGFGTAESRALTLIEARVQTSVFVQEDSRGPSRWQICNRLVAGTPLSPILAKSLMSLELWTGSLQITLSVYVMGKFLMQNDLRRSPHLRHCGPEDRKGKNECFAYLSIVRQERIITCKLAGKFLASGLRNLEHVNGALGLTRIENGRNAQSKTGALRGL